MADNLRILNDLEIVDYKVKSEKDFTIAFSKKFVEYYNTYRDALKAAVIKNMMGAIEQYPEEFTHGKKPDDGQFISMFFSTVVLSYLNDTGLIQKIDTQNMELVGGLITTVDAIHEMTIGSIEDERK